MKWPLIHNGSVRMNSRPTAPLPEVKPLLQMNGSRPFFMRVPVFLTLWTLLALLLAFQEYEIHLLVYNRAELYNEAAAWLIHFYLWAILLWFVWKAMPHFSLEVKAWKRDLDRKSTRLNSSHLVISYAVFCLKKKNRGIPWSVRKR